MRVWSGKRFGVDTEDVAGHTFEIVRTPQAASVVLLDDEGRTLLVEQDRPAVGARLTELVAGLVDRGRRRARRPSGSWPRRRASPRRASSSSWCCTRRRA